MSNNKFKVLVVEDEANICSFIETLLETNGYQALVANTCAMGQTLFTSHNPDLIILDLGLPDRDGLELIRFVRQKFLTPIVVLSARTTEQDKIEALDLGANDYITKPFGTGELLARVRTGDAAARERMVEGNLRLVLSVVQRFAQRGENLDDLFQVGCIGLIKAIDHFDPAQPVRFSTYGVPMIIGEIRRFLRDNNALRVSRSLRDTAYRAMQSRETLEKQLGREPTMDEIAQNAGLTRREVTAALESVVEPLSLEEPVYADGGDAVYVIDQVRDPDGEDSWISGLQFRQTVAGLTPREKRIMELRYLKGKTQMEVAREIGISQAQVSRLEKAALEQFHQMT